jgi:DNA-binding MarR family transcriptional regulator
MQNRVMALDPHELDTATLAFLSGDAANRVLLARIRAAGHPQVRIAHGYLIQHLVDAAPTVGELAASLGVTQQAASKSARELEHLGYLIRSTDPDDRRITRLELSDRGHDVVATARRMRRALEDEMTSAVGEAALSVVHDALRTLLTLADGDAAVRDRAVPPLDATT